MMICDVTDVISVNKWFYSFVVKSVKSYLQLAVKSFLQPIADIVVQNLVVIRKIFYFITRRTRILMGFLISSTVVLPGTNRKSHGQNSGSPAKL